MEGEEEAGASAPEASSNPAPDSQEAAPTPDAQPTTVDERKTEAAPSEPEPGSLTRLLWDEDAKPSWMKAIEDKGGKGPSTADLEKAIANASPEDMVILQQAITNMRGGMHRGLQGLSEDKGSLKTERTAFDQMKASFEEQRAAFLTQIGSMKLEPMAEGEDVEPADKFSGDWMAWKARTAALELVEKRLASFSEGFAKAGQEQQDLIAKRAEDVRVESRTAQLVAFSDAHPDFEGMVPQIQEFYAKFGDGAGKMAIEVPAERVYLMLKAEAVQASEQRIEEARRQGRRSSVRSSTSAQGALRPPSHLSGYEKSQWFRNNPEAQDAELKRIQSGQ